MLLVAAAAAPCVLACSCVEPLPLAETVDESSVVVVGRVGMPVGGRYPFTVERWFAGPIPTAVLVLSSGEERMPDGTVVVNTCGRSFTPNQQLILVGEQEGSHLATNSCGLGAEVGSPEGQKLIADAQSLYGPGVRPEQPPEFDAGPAGNGGGPAITPVVLMAIAGAGLLALVVATAVLLMRRRGT
ncbi:MAG TPA: hypothetical protein VM344_05495 [Vitreimonas sp.]|nr:hypothetical protein [Vitreimonas sp.]